MTYHNPGTKHQQLRGASLALEKEIWMFRCRVGEYGSQGDNRTFLRDAEIRLQDYSEIIKQHVIKSGTVMNTSFLSKFDSLIPNSKNTVLEGSSLSKVTQTTSKVYRHGQYPRAGVQGTFSMANKGLKTTSRLTDDHHSPITTVLYLDLRVATQLKFYQHRLPRYARIRFVFESLLIAGSLTATILAFLRLSHWAAVSTALVAMVTAYSQFHGTEKKLLRYSDAVASLDSILLWWRTLTDVERASFDAKTELVTNCELIFQNERQGWVTTSMSTKLLKKAADENSADVDKV